MIRVVARLNPLESSVVYCDIEAGLSISDILGTRSDRLYVTVDGVAIPQEGWDATRPVDGEIVVVTTTPQGIETAILAIAYAIGNAAGAAFTAIGTALGTTAFTVGTTAISWGTVASTVLSVGMSIASVLIRPQMPTASGPTSNRYFTLTQGTNQALYWEPIPKLYGKYRITPPLAGNYYSEIISNDQYLRVLLCLGHGPLKIDNFIVGNGVGSDFISKRTLANPSSILVGDTPINLLDGVDWQIGTISNIMNPPNGVRLYSRDIEESNTSYSLNPDADWTGGYGGPDAFIWWPENPGNDWVHTSGPGTVAIGLDITLPALYTLAGKPVSQEVEGGVKFTVHYRRSGVGAAWEPADLGGGSNVWQVVGKHKSPYRVSKTFKTAVTTTATTITDKWGTVSDTTTYDVKVTRTHTAVVRDAVSGLNDATWTAVRYWKNSMAWNQYESQYTQDVILMALKVKATGQLNGTLDPVSILATSVLQTYNGTNLTAPQATTNPAWIYADILRGKHLQPSLRVPDSDIDWAKLKEWADYCEEGSDGRTFEYNWYQQGSDTMLERLRAVASTGRAAWTLTDGRFSVVMDNDFTPVQMISPRNSRNFELTKTFGKIPHALRVHWINPATWQQDEVLVLNDGYYNISNGVKRDPFNRNLDKFDPYQALGWTNAEWQEYKARHNQQPTLIEVLETQGVTNKQQAFREGRYYLAALKLRPETYKVEMDMENLVAQRGDCVYLAHDALLRGRSSGRIKQITNGNILLLDEEVDLTPELDETGAPIVFCLRVRTINSDGYVTTRVSTLGAGTGPTNEVVIDSAAGYSPGDLFVFGPLAKETISVKIVQIDYNTDLSATITLVPAAPGILEADVGEIEDDGTLDPEVPPELRKPPTPNFDQLYADPLDTELSADGPRAKITAIWSIPTGGSFSRADDVYIYYSLNEGEAWKPEIRSASLYSATIGGIPAGATVTVYLQSYNQGNGKFSDKSEAKTVVTPTAEDFAPQPPTDLQLTPSNYMTSDGVVHYEVLAAWMQPGVSGGTELQYQSTSTATPESWQGSFVPSGSTYVIKGIQPDVYRVRVRTKSAISNDYSDWLQAEVTVNVRDYNPNPPTNLTAQSVANGVNLSWVNPLDPDLGSIQIYESLLNNRASATKIADLFANTYFRPISDLADRYYWVRAVDRRGNLSTWEPLDALAGVTGKALGIIGDGLPPPAPTGLTVTTKTWQATLEWTQGGEIADLVGTEVWYSTTNNRDDATRVSLVRESFYTQLNLDTDTTYYYWIRNKDVEDFYSGWFPESASGGVSATVPKDPSDYIQLLDDLVFLVVPNNLTVNGVQGSYVNVKDDVVVTGDQSANPDCVFFPAGVYIRNAMIADGSLEGVKIKAESIMSDRIDTRNLTLRDADGNIILGGGVNLDITAIDGMGLFATLNKLDAENIDLFISSGAIGNAYIGNIIKSGNYEAGVSGWQLNKEGDIEVHNLNARGTVQSTTFVPGLQGWRIDENGAVEFNSGVFRGMLSASSIIIGSDNIPSPFTLGDVLDGTAINRLDLQQSGLFFSFNQLGQVQGASSIIFTAVGNNADYAHWECIPYSASGTPGAAITLEGQDDTRVLTAAQLGDADYADVRIWFGELEDRTRIGRLTDGGTGLVGYLTNETQPLPVDANGTISSYSMAVGQFKVSYGTQDVTNLCVFSVVLRENIPVNKALISPDGTYSVTEITADVASATFRATYNDVYIEKKFKVYKAAQSAPGPAGVVIDLSQDSHTIPTESNGSNGDYSGASTTANIYEGGAQTSSLWSWAEPTTANSGLTGGITGVWSASTRTFTVTNMTQDSGTVIFRASRAGYSDQTAIFNLSKSKGGEAYYLVVESSNGIIFRPGQGKTTILKARLFSNGEEITDTVSASWFKWTRVSSVPQSPPNDDATWNTAHSAGYKQVEISVDDVYAKATFFCDIVSP